MNSKPEISENGTRIKIETGNRSHQNETSKGHLTGISSGVEINLRLTPDQKFVLDETQRQKIYYDLNIVSQKLIDFMDRFLGHYINGGNLSDFENQEQIQ